MVRDCGPINSSTLISVRLGADKANIALQQVLSDIEEVKCDVVEVKSGVVEVKTEVVEVKNEVQEVKCL